MRQTKKFINPVYNSDGSGDLIEAGDTVGFILKDGTLIDIVLTAVSDDGRSLSWDQAAAADAPRKEDVRAVDGDHVKTCPDEYGHAIVSDADDPLDQVDPRND